MMRRMSASGTSGEDDNATGLRYRFPLRWDNRREGPPRRPTCLTQQDLARKLAVGRGTVVRLEQGEAVSMVVVMKAIRLVGRDVALVPRFARLQVRQ